MCLFLFLFLIGLFWFGGVGAEPIPYLGNLLRAWNGMGWKDSK